MSTNNIKKDINKLNTDVLKIIKEISRKQKKTFYEENRILSIVGENLNLEPRACAKIYDERYGLTIANDIMTGGYVIAVLRKCKLANVQERKVLYQKAAQYADAVISLLSGNSSQLSMLDNIEEECEYPEKFKRLIMLYVANRWSFLTDKDEYKTLMKFNKSFMVECLESIIDCINDFYAENEIDSYKRELISLERRLRIANKTVESLQDSFEEELEDCKAEEQRLLISKLNSEKYGYLLDMIDNAQSGLKEMRKKRIDIPYEISSVSIIIRNLLKFVADCEITPIMSKGDTLILNSQDAEKYNYEGSSFKNDDEVKNVQVISAGWEIKSRGIIISNPHVKEIKEEDK